MAQTRSRPYPPGAALAPDRLDLWAQSLMLNAFQGIRAGCLTLHTAQGTIAFGDPAAELQATATIHHPRTFRLGVLRGEVGLGEAYVAGHWSSADPVSVVRLAVRNMAAFDGGSGPLAWVGKALDRLRHLRRANTREGSRQNIHAHYDLGNAFYQLWLDESLAYSSAFFSSAEATLEQAQIAKYERICQRLRLCPEDHLLEIGTGWGGFALHAARQHGCRITTTTLSREQFALATERVRQAGLADRVTVLLQDYRDLVGPDPGQGGAAGSPPLFDKAVSIEMFEAVGLRQYDTYFAAVDRLLKPDGSFLLQTITMNEWRFPAYIRGSDWIQQYVFPGAELASLSAIQASLTRATDLSVAFLEDLGQHYARTLAAWRARFQQNLAGVRALGFDARFERLWDWYLASCEGAFRERYTSVVQLLLVKRGTGRAILDEPWGTP